MIRIEVTDHVTHLGLGLYPTSLCLYTHISG